MSESNIHFYRWEDSFYIYLLVDPADWRGFGFNQTNMAQLQIYGSPFLPQKEKNHALVNHSYGIKD